MASKAVTRTYSGASGDYMTVEADGHITSVTLSGVDNGTDPLEVAVNTTADQPFPVIRVPTSGAASHNVWFHIGGLKRPVKTGDQMQGINTGVMIVVES